MNKEPLKSIKNVETHCITLYETPSFCFRCKHNSQVYSLIDKVIRVMQQCYFLLTSVV